MDDEEILQLAEDGELDPANISSFKDLSSELQELVSNGDLTADEAVEVGD